MEKDDDTMKDGGRNRNDTEESIGEVGVVESGGGIVSGGIVSGGLVVESRQLIQLVHLHLIENGLYESSRQLQEESGIGQAGLPSSSLVALEQMVHRGQWGDILPLLEHALDRGSDGMRTVMDEVYELCILELGDIGEMELAHATLQVLLSNSHSATTNEKEEWMSSVEQRLLDLQSLRTSSTSASASASASHNSNSNINKHGLPRNYYGEDNPSKQTKRNQLAQRLLRVIPQTPSFRFVSLIQQALKWQSYTGTLPLTADTNNDNHDNNHDNENNYSEDDNQHSSKKKKKRNKHRKRKFDLVLGTVDIEPDPKDATAAIRSSAMLESSSRRMGASSEKVVSKLYSTLKMTKGSFVECCCFAPSNHKDDFVFLTGSSDGFMEVWDSSKRYTTLAHTPYQDRDEIMTVDNDDTDTDTDTSVVMTCCVVSNDGGMLATGTSHGSVQLWNFATGKCLTQWQVFASGSGGVACLAISPNGHLLLTAGGAGNVVREWGLRSGGKLLKEFQGHDGILTTCCYHSSTTTTNVITASLDGTVKLWDSRSAQLQTTLCPTSNASVGSNCSISTTSNATIASSSSSVATNHAKPIIAAIPLHTPPNALLIVPRSTSAYVMTTAGVILRVYTISSPTYSISAATVSPSNQTLYVVTEDGTLHTIDMISGDVQPSTIPNIGRTTKDDDQLLSTNNEITSLVHHPNKTLLTCFSHHRTSRKRGIVNIWK